MDFEIFVDGGQILQCDTLENTETDVPVIHSDDHELLACRICLATDTKLFSIHEFQLGQSFENIIGYTVTQEDGFPQYLCHYCCTLLNKFEAFRAKYERAQFILTSALVSNQEISTDFLRTLDRKANELALPLECHAANEPIIIEHVEPPINMKPIKIKASSLRRIPVDQLVVQKLQEDGKEIVRVFYLPQTAEETIVGDTGDREYPGDVEGDGEDAGEDGEGAGEGGEGIVAEEDEDMNEVSQRKGIADHPNIKMVILSKTEQLEEFESRKASVGYTSAFLKCDFCYRGFMREKTYNSHMAKHDPSYGDFECPICLMRSPTAVRFRAHSRLAHLRRFVCRLCQRKDSTAKAARAHQSWHEGDFYKCSYCGYHFQKSETLVRHMQQKHSNQKLKIEETNKECEPCGVVFKSSAAFDIHLDTAAAHQENGDLWYPCKECGESFDTEESLAEHNWDHQQNVQCDECEFSFVSVRGLAIHKGQAHRLAPSTFATQTVVCEYCGREMESADELAQHKLTHSGEKPFECKYCGKRFKLAQFLQIHIRVHTKETPYGCNQCPRQFSHKANLNRHYKVHTGAKPYVCETCQRTFTQSNSLKLHIRTVHMKLPDPYRQNRRKKAGKVVKVTNSVVNVLGERLEDMEEG